MKRVYLISAIIILISCDLKISSRIRTRDIKKAITAKQGFIYVKSIIHFQVSSNKECNKNKEYLSNLLSQYFTDVTSTSCSDKGMDSYFSAKAKQKLVFQPDIPKRTVSNNAEKKRELTTFFVSIYGSSINLGIKLDKHLLNSLNVTLQDKFFTTIEKKDIHISFSFENDSESEIELSGESLYFNGVPYPFTKSIKLKPDEEVEVLVSNILRDYIFENEKFGFLRIKGITNKLPVIKNKK